MTQSIYQNYKIDIWRGAGGVEGGGGKLDPFTISEH